MTLRQRLIDAQVDAASLAAFRMLFGGLMAIAVVRVLALGWVERFYVLPRYHFTWEWIPWIRPLPGAMMHLLFVALAALALAMAAGFFYRLSATLFFIGFTYVELIDKATYLNHYYLVSLLSLLLIVLPADRLWSVDTWRRRSPVASTVPAWTITLLRFQLAVVYVFAGLAKINADWLIAAQPLRIWLAARSDLPFLGPLFSNTAAASVFSWAGAVYDLTIVFFLVWARTRPLAYLTVIVFHALTGLLFPIGMFPWIMIAATTVFFPPHWPRLLSADGPLPETQQNYGRTSAVTLSILAVYAALQVALPLRAYWPGAQPEWTYRGFNFAWRVMIAEKTGSTELIAFDPASSRQWTVSLRDYVTERQETMMAQDPFMIRALARHVADDYRNRGLDRVAIRAESFATLNGRPMQRLIDRRVNLAGPAATDWIVPLQRESPASADLRSELR